MLEETVKRGTRADINLPIAVIGARGLFGAAFGAGARVHI